MGPGALAYPLVPKLAYDCPWHQQAPDDEQEESFGESFAFGWQYRDNSGELQVCSSLGTSQCRRAELLQCCWHVGSMAP